MDMLAGLETSFSGLYAQRLRMNVIAANLANADTTRTPEGGPYKPQQVVFAAQPRLSSFAQLLDQQQIEPGMNPVHVVDIVRDPQEVRLEYDPKHPDANAAGYVAYPDINVMQEMVDLIAATRSYEANVTAINAAKNMALRALQIGRV
jgi:flagellar basal-body rod protein FlgC